MSNSLPPEALAAANEDPRIVEIVDYTDVDWVPLSYRWPAPGTARVFTRMDQFSPWEETDVRRFDRKRSRGRGPKWVANSLRGGHHAPNTPLSLIHISEPTRPY